MTTTIPTDEPIFKSDELGRIRTPLARRQSLIQEFERSGLSGAKFAALAGIKYSTFASWLQKHRRQAAVSTPAKAPDSVRWLEAVVEQAQSSGHCASVVLELPGRTRMRIEHVSQVELAAALLGALAKSC